VVLATGNDFPLLTVIGLVLLFFGLALWVWLLITVFRDLFSRDDVGALEKTGWTVLILVLPIIGPLAYLVSRSDAMGENSLRRDGDAQLRRQAYTDSVTGGGRFRGVHDETATTEGMTTAMRSA
jgi:hypothetical protein